VRGARSPQSTILVGAGGRAIVAHPGTVPPPPRTAPDAEWVHVDHVGWHSRPSGVRLSVDGGNPIDGLDLAGVALYAPTERALRERFGSAEHAVAAGAELVVVTQGDGGSAAYTRAGLAAEARAHAVDVVSTLGAGDVFHGALLAALVQDAAVEEALAFANRVAALSCRALDGRSAIPTREEVPA
jgi:hypothetical protein